MKSAPRPLFVGRERELAELTAALDDAQAGCGGIYLVAGEPGVGKTRLAQEIDRIARERGVIVAWGRCSPEGGQLSFTPWIELGRSVMEQMPGELPGAELLVEYIARIGTLDAPQGLDDIASLLPSDSERMRFFDAIAEVARRIEAPRVYVLDDAHWADMPSLRLLEFLAPRMHETSALHIVTYRDVESRGREVGKILSAAARFGHVLHLRGLDEGSVRELVREGVGVDASDQVLRAVQTVTEGNPYFVDEVVRLLVAEGREKDASIASMRIPDNVRETIRRRLDGLDESHRATLQTAAVLGRTFEIAVLERALGPLSETPLIAVAEAMGPGVITEAPISSSSFSFAHPLMREAMYEEIPPVARAIKHLQIAEALEELHAGSATHLPELANHFIAAAAVSADRAVEYAELAGRQAMSSVGYEDAVWYFSRAVEALDRCASRDARRKCRLLLSLGEAQTSAGVYRDAVGSFDRAAEIAAELELWHELGRAAHGFVHAGHNAEGLDYARAIELLTLALEHVDPNDGRLRCLLLGRLARARHFEGDPEGNIALAREAEQIALSLEDDYLLVEALDALRWALSVPQHLEERIKVGRRMIEAGKRADAMGETYFACIYQSVDLLEAGRVEEADELFESVVRGAAQWTRHVHSEWWPHQHRTRRALFTGSLPDVEKHLGALRQQAQTHGWARMALGWLDLLYALDWGTQEDIDEALSNLFAVRPMGELYRRVLRAFIDYSVGREDKARAELNRLAEHNFSDFPENIATLWMLPLLGALTSRLGDTERAEILYRKLEPFAGRIVMLGMGCLGPTSYYLGLMAYALGDVETADRHMADALAMCDRIGARSWEVRVLYEQARAAAATDRPDRADALAARGLALAEDLALSRMADRIRSLLPDTVASTPAVASDPRVLGRPTMRTAGDYWTLMWGGDLVRVRDAKGVRLLRELLGHPGREFHSVDLQGVVGGSSSAISVEKASAAEAELSQESDAGAFLDPQAKEAYRRRVEDLRAEIADAEEWGDPERVARAQDELDAIARELGRAVGLGGRDRKAADPAERARLNVTRAIRRTIDHIAGHNADLGRHLRSSVRTGTFCVYDPQPPVTWSC